MGVVVSQHALQVVSQHALHEGGLETHTQGRSWGVWPGGGLEAHIQGGLQAHTQGGLQAHTWGGVVYPDMH